MLLSYRYRVIAGALLRTNPEVLCADGNGSVEDDSDPSTSAHASCGRARVRAKGSTAAIHSCERHEPRRWGFVQGRESRYSAG